MKVLHLHDKLKLVKMIELLSINGCQSKLLNEPRTFIFLVGVQEVHMTKHSNYRILNK